jgi:hypothetical protein
VVEERKTGSGIATYPVEAVFGNLGNLADRIGAQVGEFRRFEIAPDAFDGVEYGTGQRLLRIATVVGSLPTRSYAECGVRTVRPR